MEGVADGGDLVARTLKIVFDGFLDGHAVVDADHMGDLAHAGSRIAHNRGITELDGAPLDVGVEGFGNSQNITTEVAAHLLKAGFAIGPDTEGFIDLGREIFLEGGWIDDRGDLGW